MARKTKTSDRSKYACCPSWMWHHHSHKHKMWFPMFLLVIGLFWYAKDLGLFVGVPFWPAVVILLALFMMLKKLDIRE